MDNTGTLVSDFIETSSAQNSVKFAVLPGENPNSKLPFYFGTSSKPFVLGLTEPFRDQIRLSRPSGIQFGGVIAQKDAFCTNFWQNNSARA